MYVIKSLKKYWEYTVYQRVCTWECTIFANVFFSLVVISEYCLCLFSNKDFNRSIYRSKFGRFSLCCLKNTNLFMVKSFMVKTALRWNNMLFLYNFLICGRICVASGTYQAKTIKSKKNHLYFVSTFFGSDETAEKYKNSRIKVVYFSWLIIHEMYALWTLCFR